MQEVKVSTLGFENLSAMYKEDVYFKDICASCENPVTHNRSQWLDYMLQEGLLFKYNNLCIPRCSMRENLIQEKHSGCHMPQFYKKTILFYLILFKDNMLNFMLSCK